jgi:hypothetical protein
MPFFIFFGLLGRLRRASQQETKGDGEFFHFGF